MSAESDRDAAWRLLHDAEELRREQGIVPPDWAVCERCGARAHERGNGLPNWCETCRLNLEALGAKTLAVLQERTPLDDEDEWNDMLHGYVDIDLAARNLGLLDVAPPVPPPAEIEAGVVYSCFVLEDNCSWSQPNYRAARDMTEAEFSKLVLADSSRRAFMVCGIAEDPDCPKGAADVIGGAS